jgi:hypothetical protein
VHGHERVLKFGGPDIRKPVQEKRLGGDVQISKLAINDPLPRGPGDDAEEGEGVTHPVKIHMKALRRGGDKSHELEKFPVSQCIRMGTGLIRPRGKKPNFTGNAQNGP